jgi:hypothetical protein
MGSNQVKGESKPQSTQTGSSKAMPCFRNMATLEREIKDRISVRYITGAEKGHEFKELVDRILSSSLNNNTTKLYD